AVEAIVELFDNYLRSTAGDKLMFLGSWFFSLFLFILLSNLSGLIPGMRPPTADWSITIGLALVTFVLIQVMGARYRKAQYFKDLFAPLPWWCPFPVFLPINLISEVARPISLSFRLFGNMLAGLIMMSLIYAVAPVFTHFVIPAALHAYFDVFSGVLQAYIFVTLSLTFISGAAEVTED
ncbi:MAG: F0F1 ATP synthase subunit A, partial [Oscillospiraceae bacterium]|nr:F0F1 ATP synthase subunit A [Oscillospiraceae bacterium]